MLRSLTQAAYDLYNACTRLISSWRNDGFIVVATFVSCEAPCDSRRRRNCLVIYVYVRTCVESQDKVWHLCSREYILPVVLVQLLFCLAGILSCCHGVCDDESIIHWTVWPCLLSGQWELAIVVLFFFEWMKCTESRYLFPGTKCKHLCHFDLCPWNHVAN